MARTNIKFANLRSEMGFKNYVVKDIADAIEMNRDTLSRKLSGKSPLFLDEAVKIQKKCFPNVDVLTLFKEAAQDEQNAS